MKKRKQVPAEPDVSDQDMGGRGRTGEFSAPAAKRRRLELHQESNRKQTSSRIVDLRQEEKEGFQDTSNSATGLGDTQTFRSPEHTERQGGANSQGERDQVDEAPNNIPGSDDYNGEIFDRKDNDDEGSDEGDANEVEYVVDGSPRDSSHELPEIPQKEDQ